MLGRLLPDRFVLWLLAALALGLVLPVRGGAALLLDRLTLGAIFALFFLHGVRLPRDALKAGLIDWRLHAAILATTYAVFPIAGLAVQAALPSLLPAGLWVGVLFLCALPSTVQSSIAYTAMARGNVAAAVGAAALSNLLGVFLTPLLVAAMLGAQGMAVSPAAIGKIVLLLFFPFLLGHALRPWLHRPVDARPRLTSLVDRGTILLAVYGAFSAATVAGVWSQLAPAETALLVLVCTVLLGLVLAVSWTAGSRFPRESRTALLFCGAVKSLASGAPMARILFPGAAAGLVILPVTIFHTVQLIVCAWIAARIGARAAQA